jgi:hypothetical protein
VEVHAGEQGAFECIPTVSRGYRRFVFGKGADDECGSLTQATDTTNVRLVFAAVKETILQNALKDSGIL